MSDQLMHQRCDPELFDSLVTVTGNKVVCERGKKTFWGLAVTEMPTSQHAVPRIHARTHSVAALARSFSDPAEMLRVVRLGMRPQ